MTTEQTADPNPQRMLYAQTSGYTAVRGLRGALAVQNRRNAAHLRSINRAGIGRDD